MADKPWKRIEREKCRELGGDRAGPTGRDTPDCVGLRVGLEIKYVKKFTFLTTYWEQAVDNAAKLGIPPVLAIKEAKRGGRDGVQMRVSDMSSLAGRAGELYEVVTLGSLPRDAAGHELIRFPWNDFVRLYIAAYNNNEENTLGI